MNPLADPTDLAEATRIINRYAASDWTTFTYSSHAKQRMRERQIAVDIVQEALRVGRVVSVKAEVMRGRLSFKYEVEYRDSYGRVTVISGIVGPNHLAIVTAYTDVPDDR